MRILTIILALALSVSLFACTQTEDGATTPSQPSTVETPSKTPLGYGFTYNSVTFGIGMDADQVIAALGEPKSQEKTASCAFGGYDIVYTYDNFKISANDENGFNRIYCITLINDMAETQKGIYKECSADEVTAAYGEPTSSNAAGLYYAKDGMELQFILKDGVVDVIQYFDSSVA